jgi:hypothetical protein
MSTTKLAFQLLAASNYIDALGGVSQSYRQALASYEADAQHPCEPLTNIESPLNVCQHREHCKGWKMVATDVVGKAQAEAKPAAHVLFRQDEDGLEPVMFYGPGTAPDPSTLKDRFTLRDVWLSPPAAPAPEAEPTGKMTHQRAKFFMQRFMHEEKMLGPNEQEALRHAIAVLEEMQYAPAAPAPEPFGYVSEHNCEGPFQFQFHKSQASVYWDNCKAVTAVYRAPAAPADLCERICAAIKATDDKSVDEANYMLDSNDCIDIVREHFAAAPAAPAPEHVGESDWPEYIAGLIVTHLGGDVTDERIKPIAGIIQRRMWLAAPAAPAPAGFVLVPVEPTPEMLKRFDGFEFRAPFDPKHAALREGLWRSILNAAPAAPAPDLQREIDARKAAQIENEALKARIARARLDLMDELRNQGWAPAAPAPEPLSFTHIDGLAAVDFPSRQWNAAQRFARAIERAHGIGIAASKENGNG